MLYTSAVCYSVITNTNVSITAYVLIQLVEHLPQQIAYDADMRCTARDRQFDAARDARLHLKLLKQIDRPPLAV